MRVVRHRCLLCVAVMISGFLPSALAAQEQGWSFGWEVKGHSRESEAVQFPSPFPFPFPVFISTVEPGTHTELSLVSFNVGYRSDWMQFFGKVDGIDLHDRNPTSSDREIDGDELWVKFGRGTPSGDLPQVDFGAYAKIGKFAKFERQNDRHLESYGLVSTAFNRFEDAGLELGMDVGRNFYARASFTQGNPVFIRDPNSLAGDNGIDLEFSPRPTPERGTGISILYDAEVEYELDFNKPEVGFALGLRFGDDSGFWVFDVMGFYYERDLQDSVELEGTNYGGDLDLLLGPRNDFPLGVTSRDKTESGFNLWFYRGGLSLFGQYVDQDIAGLERSGTELELAWRFELPGSLQVGGHRLFGAIAPAVRYSDLDVESFGGSGQFPAVSVRWPWERLDYGVRLDIWRGLDLTLERSDHTFVVRGVDREMEETLVTLRWRG